MNMMNVDANMLEASNCPLPVGGALGRGRLKEVPISPHIRPLNVVNTETVEMVARLTERVMRQEQLIVEERARSGELELKLALAIAELAARRTKG